MDTRYVFQPSLAPAHLFTIRYKKKVKKKFKNCCRVFSAKTIQLARFFVKEVALVTFFSSELIFSKNFVDSAFSLWLFSLDQNR